MPAEPASKKSRSRGAAALVVAALLAGGGVTALGWSATHQPKHAPQPDAAQGGSIDSLTTSPSAGSDSSTSVATPSSPTTSTAAPKASPSETPGARPLLLPASVPTTLTIQSIGVHTVVNPIGLNPDGTLQVPAPGPLYNQAAWYNGSPTPGQLGPAVIEGHVDSAADGPSVFFKLGAVRVGAQVKVDRADGSVAVFAVTGVRRFSKDNFPTKLVYGDSRQAGLRIITCGGPFDKSTGHYKDNIVVFAQLTGSHRA